MTVQAAVQMWSRHDANVESKDGSRYTARVREAYQVVTDATDELPDVINAADLPRIGDQYKSAAQIRVVNVKPMQQSPLLWIITVDYKGDFARGAYSQTGTIVDNPLSMPPIMRWGKVEREILIEEDRQGNPIVTVEPCLEPIPNVTATINDITVHITRNYAGIDLAATHRYLHSVNSDTFLGFAPGTARLTSFDADHKWFEQDFGYWEVNAEITFRYPWRTTASKAWHLRVLNQGFMRAQVDNSPFAQNGVSTIRATDESGQDTAQPIMLNSLGFPILPGQNPHYLEFEIYEPLSYNALGLL